MEASHGSKRCSSSQRAGFSRVRGVAVTRAVCTHLLLVRVGSSATCLCGGAVPPWLEAIWRLYQDEQVRGRKLLKAFLDPKSY